MIIYIVQQGDTIASIADHYKISPSRLIQDNGLKEIGKLVPGQTIVIAYALKTYTVQEGDTLQKIANENEITIIQLLRNNSFLSDREYIYPGETLVINYENNKGKITTNGYANHFIDRNTLTKTLPFLSYLTVFGYRTQYNGGVEDIDDAKLIELAKLYNVKPIMMLSTLTAQGSSSIEISYDLLYCEENIDNYIENIIRIMKQKGIAGVNITYQYINEDNREVYERFTQKVAKQMKQEGYLFFITISESYYLSANELLFEKINFTKIAQYVDGVTLLNFNWGFSFGPPGPVISLFRMKEFFDYIINFIPPEKIEVGLSIIGYDWELPYIMGVTKANSLTINSALILAAETGATIQFDEVSQTPYFKYIDNKKGKPIHHIVWFIDARSIDASMNLVKEYHFHGAGICNIMNYYQQMWMVMNTQYEIESL